MPRTGKIWGETNEFFSTANVSVHALTIKAGGYSSAHEHRAKSNLFYVVSGRIRIIIERGAGFDITTLKAGDSTTVEAGVYHRFFALENSEVIEIYETSLKGPDISRKDSGGITIPDERPRAIGTKPHPWNPFL
jgi:mannose-6-phosphate isomerase-like protein (cupin superfamily)